MPVPWTEEYQAALLEMYAPRVRPRRRRVGEQIWNFADFATSPGIMRVDGNKKGVFTRDRRPKAVTRHLRTPLASGVTGGGYDEDRSAGVVDEPGRHRPKQGRAARPARGLR